MYMWGGGGGGGGGQILGWGCDGVIEGILLCVLHNSIITGAA